MQNELVVKERCHGNLI